MLGSVSPFSKRHVLLKNLAIFDVTNLVYDSRRRASYLIIVRKIWIWRSKSISLSKHVHRLFLSMWAHHIIIIVSWSLLLFLKEVLHLGLSWYGFKLACCNMILWRFVGLRNSIFISWILIVWLLILWLRLFNTLETSWLRLDRLLLGYWGYSNSLCGYSWV